MKQIYKLEDSSGYVHAIPYWSVYKCESWPDKNPHTMYEFKVFHRVDGSSLLVRLSILELYKNEYHNIFVPQFKPSQLDMHGPDENKAGHDLHGIFQVNRTSSNSVKIEYKMTDHLLELEELINPELMALAKYRLIAKLNNLWDVADKCKKYMEDTVIEVLSKTSFKAGHVRLKPLWLDYKDSYELYLEEIW